MQSWRTFWRSMRTWQRVLLAGAGVILFLFFFFVFSFEAVHYTESTQFCSTCHSVMEPEIVTHAISAHANVACGDCHIGPGIGYKLYYKVAALRYLWTLPTGRYHRPLDSPRETMRATQEICEQCHTPENFQAVEMRADNEYNSDETNSFQRLLLAVKIGNGASTLAGTGVGAHWHIAHPVTFIAADDLRQSIPWVQTVKDGTPVTYVDSKADPASWQNAKAITRTLDCMDCHTRDGHMVHKPAQDLDNALANGLIPSDLPFVKAQAQAVLDPHYASREEGLQAIDTTLRQYYATNYPDLATARQADIQRTVDQVQTIYEQTQFPYMKVYWDTYPDNVGHEDFPGCWRCHDGNHLNAQGQAIRAECNLCHAIPQYAAPDQAKTVVNLATAEMPDSHRSSNWLAQHRFQFDATCDDCHTVSDPGGTSNSSFCSNSGCHARDWQFLQIDTPAVLAQAVPPEQPQTRKLPRIPHPVVEPMDCQHCHGPDKVLAYPEDHKEYSQEECTDCHRLSQEVLADITPAAAISAAPEITPTVWAPPPISHPLAGNENCLACHAVASSIAPAPPTHGGFTNADCFHCHSLAEKFATQPTPAATVTELPAPTATLTSAVSSRATVTASVTPTNTASPVVTPAATATELPTPTVSLTPTIGSRATVTPSLTPTNTAPSPVVTPAPTATSSTIATTVVTPTVPTVTPVTTPAPTATPAATKTPASSPTGALTPTAAGGQVSVITHPVAGNENCLACHAVNSNIAPAPPNHAVFANEECQECHKPGQ